MREEESGKKVPYEVKAEHMDFYHEYLYRLLPGTIKERDDGVLQEFLEIIGDQAAAIKQNIDEMWKNFYIDTCEEWAVPYVGDLVGTKIIANPAARNREEIKAAIHLRRLKGTTEGLKDLAKTSVGVSGVTVREFFELCSMTQNVNYPNTDSRNMGLANVKDQKHLNTLDSAKDIIPHTADLRIPSNHAGWYNPNNLGMFVFVPNIYHVTDAECTKENKYNFHFNYMTEDKPRPFQLYSLSRSEEISSEEFSENPTTFFGENNDFVVKIKNIQAAVSNLPIPVPVMGKINSSNSFLTISPVVDMNADEFGFNFIGLHEKYGMNLMEQRKFNNPEKQFIITAYSYGEDKNLHEIAILDTSRPLGNQFVLMSNDIPAGVILLEIKIKEGSLPAVFPNTVISMRDVKEPMVDKQNSATESVEGKYKNAVYAYLPSVPLIPSTYQDRVYFFVDDEGSTYFAKKSQNDFVLDESMKKTSSLGHTYPPRALTYSLQPVTNFIDLNRFDGIEMIMPNKTKEQFVLEAYGMSEHEDEMWKIGELQISPDGRQHYRNGTEAWVHWVIQDPFVTESEDESRLEWASHFKTVRLEERLYSTDQGESQYIKAFTNVIGTDKEQKERSIVDLIYRALGDFYESEDDIECTLDFFDSNLDCNEFTVTIKPAKNGPDFSQRANEIKSALDDYYLFRNEGNLVFRILRDAAGANSNAYFPLSTVKITNEFNHSMLVYLPQIQFEPTSQYGYFHVARDGSTFYEKIEPNALCRKSAGQIFPILDRYPMQHRTPIYEDLADWGNGKNFVLPGEIEIDPKSGKFAFSEYDGTVEKITASFNYAFVHNIGAGTYDITDDIMSFMKPNPGEKKLKHIYPSMFKWIAKSGHVDGPYPFPSKTFKTMEETLLQLNDGDILEIEDSSVYLMPKILKIPSHVKHLTIQAQLQSSSRIKLQDDYAGDNKFTIEGDLDSLNLYGLFFTGGTLKIKGDIKNIVISSCTLQPIGEKGFASLEVESATKSDRKIVIRKSIVGRIDLDDALTKLVVTDSIIENLSGSIIRITDSREEVKNSKSTLSLESERATFASSPTEMIRFREIMSSDTLFTGQILVDDHETSLIKFSRYENYQESLKTKKDGESRENAFMCTSEKPFFYSVKFGSPNYMFLHLLCSEKITLGGEGSLQMGAYNRAFTFRRIQNLALRLPEYVPFGMDTSLVYLLG